jgi:hypothetical protein
MADTKSDRDLAFDACDEALKDCLKRTAVNLTICLAEAAGDAAKAAECRTIFKTGMQNCKTAHQINRETIDAVFPPEKGKPK